MPLAGVDLTPWPPVHQRASASRPSTLHPNRARSGTSIERLPVGGGGGVHDEVRLVVDECGQSAPRSADGRATIGQAALATTSPGRSWGIPPRRNQGDPDVQVGRVELM
jgi:hypothetical protein